MSLPLDPMGQPLVVRNKRGRKVDETLPKSHQREVQRLFRARRTTHLADLERRVSLLERENVILRQWAGVKPSDRYLLGRGPTGCDTTKPLIADENDPELQLEIDDSSPHERNWPQTPPAMGPNTAQPRPSFVLDHGAHKPEASATVTTGHGLHPGVLGAPNVYDKPPPTAHGPPTAQSQVAGYQPPFDAHAYKPHPLYEQSAFDPPVQPPPAQHFDPNASALPQERLIKRETVYAPPNYAQPHEPSQTASYYSIAHRPSSYMSHPLTSQHPDHLSTPTHPLFAQSTSAWPDAYHPSTTTPLPRRPQITATLTPIVPPVGLTSGAGTSSSPSQQSSAGSDSRSATVDNSVYDHRRSSAQYIGPFPPASATPAPLPSASVYIPHPQVQTTASVYALDAHRDAPPSSESFRP
ncbi:SubName: Full=Uncharacterized protein {ECO:0000313/EMBL:CCA70929.1} [Serendipita indica DSM 11827]|uniref:BZIP domain-containing protein n=1 Tax=Serendipita indica (strain DSM 11827) TaxID=1109443 RepID=G4THY6_SERID|nr:SubName: Full=Uncharacterized protein {ECO:0000313/EMBL:CCA70929.1} [Serendipita indica DSM 11827]CCA70929.1 hypothetical protein PIIN_04865 [Serendipita indica DSM 11827]